MQAHAIYPIGPANADTSVVKPSPAFKKSVVKVTFAMLLFVAVYILLLATAVAIAIAFGGAGIGVIYIYPSFLTLILGVGLIISGVLLLFFLLKFIFKRNKIDYSDTVEVTATDQPALFDFIRQLTQDTQAPFPKRIFLTANVNAGVFYDSSFWSMFFPVKKNLQIGLGLVNCLNLSEFKAVMAHEFGHFSQRSMKFGSYTYQVNRVIHNMLYDNEGYAQTLNAIGRVHSFIRLGIVINIQLVKGIQELLRKMYVIVNRSYLGLSRQMEFHADAVSAYVSGANHTISSLMKIEVAQVCYNNMFNYLNLLAKSKIRPKNIYPLHYATIGAFAADYLLPLDEMGLPIINKQLDILNNSQLVISDQWSSHPSATDREASLSKISTTAPVDYQTAWVLFNRPEELQIRLTEIVYDQVSEEFECVNDADIRNRFDEYIAGNSYNRIYKGFYNTRYLTEFDIVEITAAPCQLTKKTIDDVLTDNIANIPARIRGIETDLSTVRALAVNDQIKTFDFKGIRYRRDGVPFVEKCLDEELADAQEQLKVADKDLFLFFYCNADNPTVIANAYTDFFVVQSRIKTDLAHYEEMIVGMRSVYSNMQRSEIEETLNNVYALEKEFKPYLENVIRDPIYNSYIKDDQRKCIEMYLSKDWQYYNGVYNDKTLAVFNNAIAAYFAFVDDCYFSEKKALLELQLKQIDKAVKD